MPQSSVSRYEFVAQTSDSNSRLDAFLASHLKEEGISREKIKTLIREGRVNLGDVPCDSPKTLLRAGDIIRLERETPATSLAPEAGDLTVLYQDEYLAVLDKPAGLTVHPSPNQPDGTLAHRLVAYFPELAGMEGFRPGIVHRLDKNTSGLLIAALSEQSRLALSELFAAREVFKEYLALVQGVPRRQEEVIENFMGRHPTHKTKMAVLPAGDPAKSLRQTLYADPDGKFSVQAVRIFTGRTHQIRVHMAHIGHPILGDSVYGGAKAGPAAPRQMLHAHRLAFRHPFAAEDESESEEGMLRFTCPPPEDFLQCLRGLLRKPLRVAVTGSPGSGKSTVLHALEALGLPVISADALVAELYAPDNLGHLALRSHFGKRFVPEPDAPVDKKALSAAMRSDARLRREVESLIHPLVHSEVEAFWAQATEAPARVAEIPLYFEAGYQKEAHPPLSVGVGRPFALRRETLITQRGWSGDLADDMESWHRPEADKLRGCDLVLDNSGTEEALLAQTDELAKTLTARAAKENENRFLAVCGIWEKRADNAGDW